MVVSPLSMSKRESRDAAVAELLRTEAIYVSDMKLLVDVFLIPLEGWAADMEALRKSDPSGGGAGLSHITHEDCKQIFANAKQLATFGRQFLFDLRRAYGEHGSFGLDDTMHALTAPGLAKIPDGSWRARKPPSGADAEPAGCGPSLGGQMALASGPSLSYCGVNVSDNSGIEDDPFASSVVKADSGGGGRRSGDSERGFGTGALVTVDPADQIAKQMLDVFLESSPFLKMYAVYVNNFERACDRLSRLERDSSAVAAFLTACERQRQCRGMRLRDFLVQPVQRISMYRLLLETILHHTPVEVGPYGKMQECLTAMTKIASKVNAYLSIQEQRDKVIELQHDFGGIDLLSTSKMFLKEGGLTKVGRTGPERLHFALFNDLLVYGVVRRRNIPSEKGNERGRPIYLNRREVNLQKCFIVDAPSFGTKYSSFLGDAGMMIVSEDKAFVVLADSPPEKDGWVQAIRLCMRDLWLKAEAQEKDVAGDNRGRFPTLNSARGSHLSDSAHGPMGSFMASAPRSVWVPSRDGTKTTRLVDFVLPAWAGLRRSYGCLSYTELDWGKDAYKGTVGLSPSLGGPSGMRAPPRDVEPVEPVAGKDRSGGMGVTEQGEAPRQVSILVPMTPSEQLGLRLRDVHPGCGGGVVVVGFEPKSPAKRAGVQQGDRITRVDGVAAFKGADIAWALSQSYVGPGNENGRTVHLSITRGFAKTEQPWLPPMQVSLDPLASPSSSALETLNSDDIPEVMSAPGSRTFSGDGAAGRRRNDLKAHEEAEIREVKTVATATAAAALAAAVGATRTTAANGGSGGLRRLGERSSADSSAGQARSMAGRAAPKQTRIGAKSGPGTALSTAFPSALTACWTCQIDDFIQPPEDDRTLFRRSDTRLRPRQVLPVAGACVGIDEDEDDDEDEDESDSSTASSLFLTAVSPSRVPPPLVSMASSMPPPPVSMASSVSESFGNSSPGRTWYSPSASQAETPDNSMSWLKPLPPPPPRKAHDAAGVTGQSPPPPPVRYGPGRSYSCRWAQTPPPLGEPKLSPPLDIRAEDRSTF